MEQPQSIFDSPAAAQGKNGRSFNIPSEHAQAILWLIQRITKLTNERLMTAGVIKDCRVAAKNDGYDPDELSFTKKLHKMSPERRDKFREKMERSLARFGFTINVREQDPPADKLLESHLQKLKIFEAQRSELSAEISETYKAAADRGINIKALKQIINMSYMSEDERVNYSNDFDNIGTIAKYW